MKRMKKIVSFLCAAALCFGLLPPVTLITAEAAYTDYQVGVKATHVLEITTGEVGISTAALGDIPINITIEYDVRENVNEFSFNSLDRFMAANTVEDIEAMYEGLTTKTFSSEYPNETYYDNIHAYLSDETDTVVLDDHTLIESDIAFEDLTDTQMHTLMSSYTAQSNRGTYYAALRPYTTTYLAFDLGDTLAENFHQIKSIKISLADSYPENSSISIQSVRLFEYFDDGSQVQSYWNGAYSQERIPVFEGFLLAESAGGSTYRITSDNPLYFSENADSGPVLKNILNGDQYILDVYHLTDEEFNDKYPKTSATMVDAAISLDIANIAGGGIETLLADTRLLGSIGDVIPAQNALSKIKSAHDASGAYGRLSPNTDNPLKLKITYLDDLGRTRQVSIPFIGVYLTYILKENNGKLCLNRDSYINGVMQQGQTVGFPFKLANYQSLISIELTYGAKDDYTMLNNTANDATDSTLDPIRTIDCATDTLAVESLSFYVGEDVAGAFSAAYDPTRWEAVFKCEKEDLTADYSYSAPTYRGSILAENTALQLKPGDGKLVSGDPVAERTLSDTYLVEITSSTVDKASTYSLLTLDLTYVSKNGATKTITIDTREQVGSLYGYINRTEYESVFNSSSNSLSPYDQYRAIMATPGSTLRFLIEGLSDVDHFVSVTYQLSDGYAAHHYSNSTLDQEQVNEYQVQSIYLYKATGIGKRYGSGNRLETSMSPSALGQMLMEVEIFHEEVPCAFSNRQVLLQASVPTASVNLTYVNTDGNAVVPENEVALPSTYLNGLPTAMTYEDTLKDLGLTVAKYDYQVTVNVSDEMESGSQNYFFFQLVFENGTSGVVLANQQLQSDSFREGCSESFTIQTTQNYGDLVSVRIICDRVSNESDVFDKLNLDSIVVTANGSNGVVEVWRIDGIGWIDITYTDERSEYYYTGSGDAVGLGNISTKNNASIIKEYPVTGTDTQVMLQFCIATANSSTDGNPPMYLLGGNFYVTLNYIAENGQSKSIKYSLTDLIYEYNDSEDQDYLFRPNHVDRFTISTTDMKSLTSISLSRSDGANPWVVKNVSVQLVSERTDVYLQATVQENVISGEYVRNVKTQADLAETLNTENITIDGNGTQTLYFTENTISIAPDADTDSWNATVTRVPQVTTNTLNVYIFPGARTVTPDKIVSFHTGLDIALNYSTLYGANTVQSVYSLDVRQTEDGGTMIYGSNLSADAMSSLCSMTIMRSDYDDYLDTMVVDYAVVEQVRNGVIVDTYFFDFNSDTSMDQTRTPNNVTVGNTTTQRVRMQLAPDQNITLTPETYDVAVAIRYTSASDVANTQKQVFRSPYIYLTDQEYTSLISGQDIYLDFAVPNVGQIVGINVVTTGPVVTFDKCAVYGFSSDGQSLNSVCSIVKSFTATTTAQSITAEETDLLIPATFTFTTAEESKISDAGTYGQVQMTIKYLDDQDKVRETVITDISPYITSGSLEAGSTATLSIMLDNARSLQSIALLPVADDWFITSVSAQLQLNLNETSSCTTTVYNWAKPRETLTIDVRPATERNGQAIGNEIKSLSLSAQSENAKEVASAVSGNVLQIKAYPGDVVKFDPYIVYIGNPNTDLVWSSAGQNYILVESLDNSAIFYVPSDATPGTNYNFSVQCAVDDSLMVLITVSIVEEPEPTEPPHVHTYIGTVTAPTCTDKGFTSFECECGDSYTDNEVEPTGHSYESEVTAPSCTADGYTTHTCSICEYSYKDNVVPATGHSYETRTDGAYILHTCSVCGDREYEIIETTPPETETSETEPPTTEPETEPANAETESTETTSPPES